MSSASSVNMARAEELTAEGSTFFAAEKWANLGTTSLQSGFFNEAEEYYTKSVGILNELSGPESLDVALASVPLAQLLGMYMHRFDEAVLMLENALRVFQVAFTDEEDHPALLETKEILQGIISIRANSSPSRPTSRAGDALAPRSQPQPQPQPHNSLLVEAGGDDVSGAQPFDDNVSVLSEESALRDGNFTADRVEGATLPAELEEETPYSLPPMVTYKSMLSSSRSRPSTPASPGEIEPQNPRSPLLFQTEQEPESEKQEEKEEPSAQASPVRAAAKPVHARLAEIAADASGVESDSQKSSSAMESSDLDAEGSSPSGHEEGKRKKKHRKHGEHHHHKRKGRDDEAKKEDEEDEDNSVKAAPVEVTKVEVFPVAHATFQEEETRLSYSVEYIELPAATRALMNRQDDEPYKAAVGTTFHMPLFPPQVKKDGRYKPEILQCARLVMSTRIRRLLLENEIRELRASTEQFVDLLALCHKKKAAHRERLLMLEQEMEHIAEDKQGTLISPGSRFGALLSTRPGWVVVFEFLSRECKRLQLPEDQRAVVGEDTSETIVLDDILHFWDLMQMWQLLHSVFYRCRTGAKAYPIATKAVEVTKTVEVYKFEDDSDKTEPPQQQQQQQQRAWSSSDPSTSILAGQQAGQAALSDDFMGGDGGSVLEDTSTIASRASLDKDKDKQALLAEAAGEGSVASEKSKHSKKSKDKDKAVKEESKPSSGWGLSFNLFGKKEVVKEVEVVQETIKLKPVVGGFGLGEWSEVCEALGCKAGDASLLSAAKEVIKLLEVHAPVPAEDNREKEEKASSEEKKPTRVEFKDLLHGIVPLVLKTDIQVAIEGMTAQEDKNPFLYNAMKHVLDAVADEMERGMLEALRLFPNWAKTLEAARKDRVRKSGGKMDSNHEGQVEVDKHGAVRIIPNADDIVDTDLLHGSRQRIRVTMVMPELEKRIGEASGKEAVMSGELACAIQFGYCVAAPIVQRAIRGTLARMRRAVEMKDLALYAMHAAAFTIQGRVRAKQGRKNFARAKEAVIGDVREGMVMLLQRSLRMLIKRFKYLRYIKDKRYRHWWFGISKMQALIRGFNARHRVRRLKAGHKEDRQVEEKQWNVELLQRVARGYIARKTVVRSLRIRKSISKRVLLLAEKYLERGDLWSFLKEIDDEFGRLGKEINTNKQREDEFAETFIDKVLHKRQSEFDGAWDRFGRTLTASSNKRDGAGGSIGESTELTAVGGGGDVVKTTWGPSSDAAPTETAIPGPVLRRAVSATVQEGVKREVQRQKEGQERGVKLAQKMKEAYDSNGGPSEATKNAMTSSKSSSSSKQQQGKSSTKKKTAATPASSSSSSSLPPGKISKEMEEAIRVNKKRKQKTQQPNNMAASTSDFLATAVAKETSGFAEPKDAPQQKTGWDLSKATSGESLLVDIPKGINDTMERLMRATALRCYVPEFFSGHDAASAYKMYLMLPPGLAKMRYEQEAFRFCQPAVNQLRVKGINLIKDAMPAKRVRQFLVSVKTPPVLLNEVMDNLFLLIKIGDVASGLVHSPTMQRQMDISESRGTISQVLSAMSGASPPKPSAAAGAAGATQGTESGSPSRASSRPQSPSATFASGSSTVDRDGGRSPAFGLTDSSTFGGKQGQETEEEEEDEEVGDPTLPNRLLVDMVERGEWSSMTSSVDSLLMHAAFLSVPHVERRANKYGIIVEKSTPWGHVAFKAHTKACQRVGSDEDRRRELVRERFRSCLLLTTPYTLRLKADGTLTVQDLVERTDLKKLGMNEALFDQVEALISTAISLSVSSKVVPTVRDHLSTSTEIFTVPMIFDPKFQRGPFDPYGRAPRIFPRLNLKKTKPDKRPRPSDESKPADAGEAGSKGQGDVAAGDEVDDDDDDMPLGLWEKKEKKINNSLAAKHAKKLFAFQSDAPTPTKGGKGKKTDAVGDNEDEQELFGEESRGDAQPSLQLASPGPLSPASLSLSSSTLQQTRPRSKKEMHEKARLFRRDFEAKVRSGFERPYTCSHPGCPAAFSRAYSLKVHEKSHELFGGYHKFRHEPQLFLDPDNEGARAAAQAAFEASVSLPPLVQQEIVNLRVAAAAKAWALTYEEQERLEAERNKPPSRPTTAQVYGDELVFPHSVAPASKAYRDLPPSRGETPLPAPSSPWKLPSRNSSPLPGSRGSSRGGILSRGGSRGKGGGLTVTPWSQADSPPPSVPGTPMYFPPSPSGRSPSRGNVRFAFDFEEGENEEKGAQEIRFGMTMSR